MRHAAQTLFAQHGYAAVSMRQIAREVGVQAGALYNYTPDKQSLLFDLMKSHLDELLAAWLAEPVRATAPERLEQFTRFHIRFHSERPDAVFIAYMELRNLTEANFAEIERLRGAYEQALEDILQDGMREGSFELKEPKIAAMAVIAMLTGVNTWFREGGRLSLPEVEAIYWEMVMKAVST